MRRRLAFVLFALAGLLWVRGRYRDELPQRLRNGGAL